MASTRSPNTARTGEDDMRGGTLAGGAGEQNALTMRVQLVDPSGDVTPYDHSLAAALARRGADVELVTSRFLYGPIPAERDYRVTEAFYRLATRGSHSRRVRRALKLAEHGPDMLRYRRRARHADVRHWQWLPVEPLDLLLLPPARPRVLTMHNVLRREGQRLDAPARRAHGRGGGAHAGGARELERLGRGRRPGAGDPPRRLRAPDAPARRGSAAPGAGRGRGAGDPVLRHRAPLQGRGGAARGLPRGRGRRALDRRQTRSAWTSSRCTRWRPPRPAQFAS